MANKFETPLNTDLQLLGKKKPKKLREQLMSPAQSSQVDEVLSAVKPESSSKLQQAIKTPVVENKKEETKLPSKKAAKDRSTGNAVSLAAKEIKKKTPGDVEKSINDIYKSELMSGLQSNKDLTELKKAINDKYSEAKKQYDTDKNEAQWKQVAETLGQALVQLGAGAYGLKHGVDMSGVKFNKTDWANDIDRSLKELQLAGAERDKDLGTADKGRQSILSRLAKLGEQEQTAANRQEDFKREDKQRAEDSSLKRELAASKQPVAKPGILDRAIEKQAGEFETKGRAKLDSKLGNLNEAITLLNKENTGTFTAGLNRSVANVIGRGLEAFGAVDTGQGFIDGAEVQRLVEQMQQANIGEVLDSQFAAREADQVLKRGFDPAAPKEVQLKVLNTMRDALKKAKIESEALSKHLKAGGKATEFISPYKGTEDKVPGQTKKPVDKRARLEELRKKKAGQ